MANYLLEHILGRFFESSMSLLTRIWNELRREVPDVMAGAGRYISGVHDWL